MDASVKGHRKSARLACKVSARKNNGKKHRALPPLQSTRGCVELILPDTMIPPAQNAFPAQQMPETLADVACALEMDPIKPDIDALFPEVGDDIFNIHVDVDDIDCESTDDMRMWLQGVADDLSEETAPGDIADLWSGDASDTDTHLWDGTAFLRCDEKLPDDTPAADRFCLRGKIVHITTYVING